MTTKRLIHISYFTMLTIIGGLIKIPVGTVAFTLQTLFVISAGLFLGAKDGAFAQLVYMIIGLIGIPVFTQGGGIYYIFKPSFGYILSFPIGAFLTGFLIQRSKTIRGIKLFLFSLVGLVSIYIVGMAYQVMILVLVNGLEFAAACATLVSILLYFVVDVVTVYILTLIYPRVNNLVGLHSTVQSTKPINPELKPDPQNYTNSN